MGKTIKNMEYKNILLVDDDQDDRMLFEQTLEELYPSTHTHGVENGLEMMEWLDQCPDKELPDLIILDQYMPKMSGKESLVFIKESSRYSYIPVIIYSTSHARDFFFSCRELGALDVISKPDTMQSYRDMIGKFVIPPPEPSSVV
jgi:CheY-like chemotaxis protein